MSSQTSLHSDKSRRSPSFSKKLMKLQEFIVARPIESVLSIFFAALIGILLWQAASWAIFDAVWSGGYQACSDAKESGNFGACWAAINFWGRFILFGRYPIDEIWRPILASLLIIGGLACCLLRFLWWRNLFILWAVLLAVFLWLMRGGLGLKPVDIDNWGGLPLTITVAAYSIIPALILGVLLALGRTSKLPMIRSICVCFIELVAGGAIGQRFIHGVGDDSVIFPRWVCCEQTRPRHYWIYAVRGRLYGRIGAGGFGGGAAWAI